MDLVSAFIKFPRSVFFDDSDCELRFALECDLEFAFCFIPVEGKRKICDLTVSKLLLHGSLRLLKVLAPIALLIFLAYPCGIGAPEHRGVRTLYSPKNRKHWGGLFGARTL